MRSHAPEKHHGAHARGAQGPAGLISPSYGIVVFMHWGPGAVSPALSRVDPANVSVWKELPAWL
jgi:hypothetical protein